MVTVSAVRNLVFNAAFLASVAVASAVSVGGGIFQPFRPPTPPAPPPPPPKATYTISYLPAGGIWTSTDQCSASPLVGGLTAQTVARYIDARRQADFGLPALFIDADVAVTADNHMVDMIQDGYVSIITNDSPPLNLISQLNLNGQGQIVEAKTIILVGCFGNNRAVDLWNVLQSDPGFASIVNRPDWDLIGAIVRHPSQTPFSYPGLPSQNYWQIIFVKI